MMAPFLFSSVNGKSKYIPYLCGKSVNARQSADNKTTIMRSIIDNPTSGIYIIDGKQVEIK